jgi:hypothetical protein
MLKNRNSFSVKIIAILVLTVSFGMLNSCSVKKIGKEAYQPEKSEGDFIKTNDLNYNSIERIWFKKFVGEFESNGGKQKFKGNIRLVKDSLMIIGLASNMGVEGFRILLRPDSVFILNRLKATYYAGPVSDFRDSRLRILNFDVLQDLLLVNTLRLFHTDAKPDIEKDNLMQLQCYTNKEADYQVFTAHNKLIARKICYRSKNGLLNSGDFIFSEWNENIIVTYPEYANYENIRIPLKIILTSRYREKTEKLELSFGKTEVNLPFPATIKIASKYKKVRSFNDL